MNILINLFNSIKESFFDVWSTFPILFLLYFFLEWHGHKKGFSYFNKFFTHKFYNPILGAILGFIPQCGMSVLLTGLYLRGIISTGTLLSVYVATSDEAFLVMVSHLENAHYIFLIMGIKLITASFLGIIIDNFFKLPRPEFKSPTALALNFQPVKIEPTHSAGKHDWHPIRYSMLLLHSFKHSFTIFLYIFIFSILFSFSLYYLKFESISSFLSRYSYIEIIGATLIGLIPNCIASVTLAEAFLQSSLSFGAVVAGLSSAAGLGLILLFKEIKLKSFLRIITILFLYSILTGFVVNYLFPHRIIQTHIENKIEKK